MISLIDTFGLLLGERVCILVLSISRTGTFNSPDRCGLSFVGFLISKLSMT
jgi:hypothetical protein